MELTPDQRRAIAGLLGTAGHTLGHVWAEFGEANDAVRDAITVAGMIGWTRGDMEGLWRIAVALCEMGVVDA